MRSLRRVGEFGETVGFFENTINSSAARAYRFVQDSCAIVFAHVLPGIYVYIMHADMRMQQYAGCGTIHNHHTPEYYPPRYHI